MVNLLDFITNTFSWLMIGMIAMSFVLAGYIIGYLTGVKKAKDLTSSLKKDIINSIKKS